MATQQDATVNIHVNNQEAEEKVRSLNQQATELRKKLADAVRIQDNGTIDKTKKELKKVTKELDNARLRAARVRESMKHLSQATPKELQNTLKLINQELNSGAVKRGSKEWKAYQEQIKQVNAELRKIQAESRETESSLNRANNFISKWGNAIVGGLAAMAGVTMAGKQAVQAYADMDSAMANTQKFTGMTREEVELLNEEFKKMDTRTSREGLNELAQAAGRLGKNSVEDVMGFVRAGDIIGVAMDELGAEAPQIISQLAGIFNLEGKLGTEKAMLSVGSAINTLSQNCAAGAPNLVDFASRLGAIANSTNMSMDEMLAFGALLDDQKVSIEKSSTAIQGVITKMYADPATFAKKVGLNVQEFTDALKRSSTEGIMMFVDALSKMDSMQQAATLKDLGTAGAGVVQTFQTLAGKTELLQKQMATSKLAFADATSATEEFNVQNNTVQADLDKAKKGFNEMAVSLGEKLLPAMKYSISSTSMLMRLIKSIIEFVIKYKGVIISLATAVIAYNTALKLSVALEKIKAGWTAVCTAKVVAFRAAKLLAAAAVALFSGNTQVAIKAWKLFSTVLSASPLGLAAAALGTVVGAIIHFNVNGEKAKKIANDFKDKLIELTNTSNIYTAEVMKEKSELDNLFTSLKKAENGSKDYQTIKDTIVSKYGQYLTGLINERGEINNLELAYKRLNIVLERNAKLKGIDAARGSAREDYFSTIGELSGQLSKALKERGASDQQIQDILKDVHLWMEKGGSLSSNAQNLLTQFGTTGVLEKYGITWKTSNNPINIVASMTDVRGAYYQADKSFNAFENAVAPLQDAQEEELNIIKKTAEGVLSGKGNLLILFQDGKMITKQGATKQDAQSLLNLVDEEILYRDAVKGETQIVEADPGPYSPAVSDKELKKRKKEEEKRRKEEEKTAEEALKKELEAKKAARDTEHALNLLVYSLGLKNYAQYVESKHQIDVDAIAAQKKVLEEANLTETQEYAKLLKKEEELNAKHLQTQSQLKKEQLDREYKAKENQITSNYLDPNNNTYSSEKSYRQALFDLDVEYMKKKRDLYLIGSKEWEDINQEINDKIAEDQIQKQKETADALAHFQEEYGKASGSAREKMELDILDNLFQQGLITEEEYNKARNAIRDKYRNEDREKERTVQSEYADMVVNLYDSFKKFFDELGQDGSNFWENLEGAATAAFALMSAGLQQYSAYVNAERDLELAKIEHHYDAEIKAAGKNTKKKEKLEKDKEAKIAEVKKKYNERAMKIEMANAVAQTALAAISAYASGSQVNVFMGPIAAALALAAGAVQIATIKKQHQAEAIGYYEGGFTGKALDNHKEVGVVHANEFVANHKAVANPRLAPLFHLLDSAQRNNTVGSLTANDVSNALGQGRGVTARAEVTNTTNEQVGTGLALVGATLSSAGDAIDRLNKRIDDGIETVMIMDGERGFAKKYENYNKRINNAKR